MIFDEIAYSTKALKSNSLLAAALSRITYPKTSYEDHEDRFGSRKYKSSLFSFSNGSRLPDGLYN